jgi:hypothetical protein
MEKSKLVALILIVGSIAYSIPVVTFLNSRIFFEARQITLEEETEMKVFENTSTKWITYNFLHRRPSDEKLEGKAVIKLIEKAHRQGFDGNIGIKNIKIEGKFNPLSLLGLPVWPALGNFQTVRAYGDVVRYID